MGRPQSWMRLQIVGGRPLAGSEMDTSLNQVALASIEGVTQFMDVQGDVISGSMGDRACKRDDRHQSR